MKEKAKALVVMKNGRLEPATQYDAVLLETYGNNQEFEATPVKGRSNPHHNLYWAALQAVVISTNRWATKDHLHSDLKMLCGYYHTVINGITGQLYYVPDSIAFDKMDQQEFSHFFELAMEKLSGAVGYDPLKTNL
jgi:hypothetical protein|tara:strand:+ start:968 stop:1375 length:408 start_codon:yes stop_codon:yes gene_type:complete